MMGEGNDMQNATFHLSFQCYYPDGGKSQHYQDLKLSDIPRWIDSYKFTHPNCDSITVKVWFKDLEEQK